MSGNKINYLIIEASIKNHNKYFIDKEYGEETMLHIKIIRDSDKIDILNICYQPSTEDYSNKKHVLKNDKIIGSATKCKIT